VHHSKTNFMCSGTACKCMRTQCSAWQHQVPPCHTAHGEFAWHAWCTLGTCCLTLQKVELANKQEHYDPFTKVYTPMGRDRDRGRRCSSSQIDLDMPGHRTSTEAQSCVH
jgi:hypothetical protein